MTTFARFDPDDPTERQVPGGCPDCVGPSPEPGDGWGHAPGCVRYARGPTLPFIGVVDNAASDDVITECHGFRFRTRVRRSETMDLCEVITRVAWHCGDGWLTEVGTLDDKCASEGQIAQGIADVVDINIAQLLQRMTPPEAAQTIQSRTCSGCGIVQRWDTSQPFDSSVYFESADWRCRSCGGDAPLTSFEANERRMIDDIKARLMTNKENT